MINLELIILCRMYAKARLNYYFSEKFSSQYSNFNFVCMMHSEMIKIRIDLLKITDIEVLNFTTNTSLQITLK